MSSCYPTDLPAHETCVPWAEPGGGTRRGTSCYSASIEGTKVVVRQRVIEEGKEDNITDIALPVATLWGVLQMTLMSGLLAADE